MPATLSTVSRRLFRMSRSVLNPHLSLNRKPKAVQDVLRQDKWVGNGNVGKMRDMDGKGTIEGEEKKKYKIRFEKENRFVWCAHTHTVQV